MDNKILSKRIQSIDILRGIVMVIMALDHTRDFFHLSAWTDDPLNLETTTPALFFTRWITHFCAPTFVFLSGVSIYLQSLRKTKPELSVFIIKRGVWLIFVELMIVSFAWSFNPAFERFPLGVIWAIGVSMFILGFLIRLPYKVILGLGLLIVFGHNLLDFPEAAIGFNGGFWLDLLHSSKWSSYHFIGESNLIIAYPFLPWLGLMMVGYCAGKLFSPQFDTARRKKLLTQIGIGLLVLFVVLRDINIYGDPVKWSQQKDGLYTFFSFINIHKYPPSLLYLCVTIGCALLLLPYLEKLENRFTKISVIFGRTAFFYYILHLYLIHVLAMISFYIHGHTLEKIAEAESVFKWKFIVPGEGFGLLGVYLIWIFVILCLYPLCKWYDKYKTNNKEKWWLSYL
nr:heparan-alpha-glucosaminide N-acetyltransferase domain-containing protein [uncultured Flavobacterium sp.]